jgi:hypothetical protein
MAIIGESFEPYINDQILIRQKIYGKPQNRTPQELTYLNGRTAWVRLISSVNIKNHPEGSNNEGTEKLQSLGLDDSYLGSKLAKEYILFAGVSNANNTTTEEDFGGSRNPKILADQPNIKDLRFGVNNGAYGLGGTEYGLQPMPTLGDVEIKYRNRGSLRESNLTIKCFNDQQFKIIDTLYLRVGYTVLLEWGNSCYFDNKRNFISNNSISMQDLMFDTLGSSLNHFKMLQSILHKRDQSNGNYDAFYGKVSNYSWTFENGVYNINLKLISLGDVIESLNINYLSPNVEPLESEDKTDIEKEKTIKSERDKNDLARLFFTAKDEDLKITLDQIKSNPVNNENPLKVIALFYFKKLKAFITNGEYDSPVKAYSLKLIAKYAGFNLTEYDGEDNSNNQDFINVILDDVKQTYIKFSSLLEFIEKTQLYYTDNNNTPAIKFDYRTGYSFMITNKWVVPANPKICLFNPNVISLTKELKTLGDKQSGSIFAALAAFQAFLLTSNFNVASKVYDATAATTPFNVSFLNALPEFKTEIDEESIGDIMNIYLNVDFVFNKLIENLDDKNRISIYKFLDTICTSINSNLGGLSSITPFIDESINVLSIIEEGTFANKYKLLEKLNLNTKNTQIQLFGYNNLDNIQPEAGFVKSFNLKTEITNELASMISIGAQASGEIVKGIDATVFSAWNKGLIDRIIPIKKDSSETPEENTPTPTLSDEKNKLIKKYKTGLSNYLRLLMDFDKDNVNLDDTSMYESGLKSIINYDKELIQLENKFQNKSIIATNPSFLPINLNLTLDGISGPTMLQEFEVEGRFLPHPIPNTLSFLIKGLSHKISNNTWVTTIDSLSIPKNIQIQDPNNPSQPTVLLPTIPSLDFSPLTPNTDRLRETLKVLGYQEKGNEISNSGDITTETANMGIAVFTQIKTNYPNLKLIVTGGNDKYHQLKASPNSRHRKGLGLDFVILPKSSTNVKNIEKILQGFAAGSNRKFRFLNEYKLQTVNATGEHFHMSWGEGIEGLKSLEESIKLANNNQIETYTI